MRFPPYESGKRPMAKRKTEEEILAANQKIEEELQAARAEALKDLPEGLVITSEIKGYETWQDIYFYYANAMQRRAREPLSMERFISHFSRENYLEPLFAYGDQEKGYIFGYHESGVFIPTHFAPKSIREGVIMWKELGESKEIPVVAAITTDLADTLKKIDGWHVLNKKITSTFRDEEVEKVFVYNSAKGIKAKLAKLAIGKYKDMYTKYKSSKYRG